MTKTVAANPRSKPRATAQALVSPLPLVASTVELDRQLAQLLRVDGAGRPGHQVAGLLRLRKRDDVANAVDAAEEHDQAIDTQRDAAMRRRRELQCVE